MQAYIHTFGILMKMMYTRGILITIILVLTSCKSEVKTPEKDSNEPQGTIAFVSTRDGNREIYIMDPAGENLRNISNNPALDYGPSWLPDGSGIMAYSNRDGNPEIYLFDLQRDSAIRITTHPGNNVLPEVSLDGKEIVFMSNRNGKSRSVYKMKIDGSDQVALTDNDAYEESPSWSPDGRHILFTRQLRQEGDTTHAANGEIFRMRSDGSQVERITDKEGYDSGAIYSPDGKQIAFYGPDGETFDIFLMKADGSDIRNITRDTLDCYSPSWSPDGKWIAYTAGSEDQYDIYIIHPESGEKRRLTNTSVRNESPSWGPVTDR
ncbi:hypothetical protein GCM10011361_10500 [Muriicola marianensis]|uniref:Prolow-density lipoprotein receptor-related protein 1-like beta-propeller domain-containing protein n=2 Tax=Muriicola marianensis TaxID=1324801 RepID=A0ABQ1QV37_9FLAO|nr:hypothetical protein GCM10011361_10500 [Muriicola marianensis]